MHCCHFTVDSLLAAAYDSYLPAFAEDIPVLLKAWDAAYRKALTLWLGLVQAHPENPDYAAGLKATRDVLSGPAGGGTAIG